MIIHKWIVFPARGKQVAVGYYPGSHCAPSLLIGLINMFMLKQRPEGFEGSTCAVDAYYPHQVELFAHQEIAPMISVLGHSGNSAFVNRCGMRALDASCKATHFEMQKQEKGDACK